MRKGKESGRRRIKEKRTKEKIRMEFSVDVTKLL